MIIGSDKEERLKDWTTVLRAGALDGGESKEEPDTSGWLLRKSPDGIGWWKLRWFELRGTTLLYWNSDQDDVAGRFQLPDHVLFFPKSGSSPDARQPAAFSELICCYPTQAELEACASMKFVLSRQSWYKNLPLLLLPLRIEMQM